LLQQTITAADIEFWKGTWIINKITFWIHLRWYKPMFRSFSLAKTEKYSLKEERRKEGMSDSFLSPKTTTKQL
jgi:hypothetical protein